MKLYTKEMFLKASRECEVSMIDAEHIMKHIDEYVTPIELPTDEEIKKYADYVFPDVEKIGGEAYNAWRGLKIGAKWVLEQIKQQSK